jgi:hypothetical protein
MIGIPIYIPFAPHLIKLPVASDTDLIPSQQSRPAGTASQTSRTLPYPG